MRNGGAEGGRNVDRYEDVDTKNGAVISQRAMRKKGDGTRGRENGDR